MQHALVIFAKDKARVSAFYRQALGLEVLEEEGSHDLLEGHGIEVVVHAIPLGHAAGIQVSTPPRLRENAAFKPVFFVDDLEAVRVGAEATGGSLKPPAAVWEFRGSKVLDGWDPEGNVIQIRQNHA